MSLGLRTDHLPVVFASIVGCSIRCGSAFRALETLPRTHALNSALLPVFLMSAGAAAGAFLPLTRRLQQQVRSPVMSGPPAAAAALAAASGPALTGSVGLRRRPEHPYQRAVGGRRSLGRAARNGDSPAAAEGTGEAAGGGALGPSLTASSSWHQREAPLGNRVIHRLLWQQRRHLGLAAVSLLCCVAMNLLSPVLQGMLFDVLVRGQPFAQ